MVKQASSEKLMQDLRTVMEDAEALLKATAGQAGEKVAEARARAEDSIRMAKEALGEVSEEALARTRELTGYVPVFFHQLRAGPKRARQPRSTQIEPSR